MQQEPSLVSLTLQVLNDDLAKARHRVTAFLALVMEDGPRTEALCERAYKTNQSAQAIGDFAVGFALLPAKGKL